MDRGQWTHNQQGYRTHLHFAQYLLPDIPGPVWARVVSPGAKGVQPHQNSVLSGEWVLRKVLFPVEITLFDPPAGNYLPQLGRRKPKVKNQVDGHDEVRPVEGRELRGEVHIHQPDPPSSTIDIQIPDPEEDGARGDGEPGNVETEPSKQPGQVWDPGVPAVNLSGWVLGQPQREYP